MQEILELLYESLSLITAITIGGFTLGYLNKFMKLFWWQLVIWAFTLILMYVIPIIQKNYGLEQNNTLIANIHMLFEYSFLLIAAYLGFEKVILKRFVLIGAVVIYGVWLTEILTRVNNQYLDKTDLTSCFVFIAIFSTLIYDFFHKKTELKWCRRPEIIVSIGVLVYFSVSIPYVSIMNYLQENGPRINAKLLTVLSDTSVNIRYICAAIAFYIVYKNRKEPIHE